MRTVIKPRSYTIKKWLAWAILTAIAGGMIVLAINIPLFRIVFAVLFTVVCGGWALATVFSEDD